VIRYKDLSRKKYVAINLKFLKYYFMPTKVIMLKYNDQNF